jgi:hypothetical protein
LLCAVKFSQMVEETFYVANDERMNKVKNFIRQNMPTARFKNNPYKYSNGKWEFNISYELPDMNKLSILLNEFYVEDSPPLAPKKRLWQRILGWLS